MSKYFQENETIRITFDDTNWVDLKQELTQADEDYIANKMMHAQGIATSVKETKAELVMDFGKMALLERSIVAWSFEVPVTPENISKLRAAYRSKVLTEADLLQKQAKEAIKN